MAARLTAIMLMWLVSTAFAPDPISGSTGTDLRVVEGRSILLEPDAEVALGSDVEHLPTGMSLEAYDPEARNGLVQWRPDGTSTVIGLVEDGRVVGVSVAFTDGVVTEAGISLGDPESRLFEAYGSSVEDGRAVPGAPEVESAYVLVHEGADAQTFTYFDVSCTGRVEQVGLAAGSEGLVVLAGFWQPHDPTDPCPSFH